MACGPDGPGPIGEAADELETLSIEILTVPRVGAVGEVRAIATFRDGTSGDVTREVSWSSSDPDQVAAFDDVPRKGLLYGTGRAPATTITARLQDQTATAEVETLCGLEPSSAIRLGQVLPAMSWARSVIYDVDGHRTDRALSVELLMCDPAFDPYVTFIFSLSALWSRSSNAWMRTVADSEAKLSRVGIMPVFVVGDTRRFGDFDNATTETAERLSQTHAGSAMSIRVGDAETMGAGTQGVKQVLDTTQAWPTLFAVRRSDMRVLPLDAGAPRDVSSIIDAVNLHSDEDDAGSPSDCAEGVDEGLEPNDTSEIAAEIGEGVISGGICNGQPDFYRVELEGAWRATLAFQNSVADIALFEWDPETDGVMVRDDREMASPSSTRDSETLELKGEALLSIRAETGGAPYTLVIERL